MKKTITTVADLPPTSDGVLWPDSEQPLTPEERLMWMERRRKRRHGGRTSKTFSGANTPRRRTAAKTGFEFKDQSRVSTAEIPFEVRLRVQMASIDAQIRAEEASRRELLHKLGKVYAGDDEMVRDALKDEAERACDCIFEQCSAQGRRDVYRQADEAIFARVRSVVRQVTLAVAEEIYKDAEYVAGQVWRDY